MKGKRLPGVVLLLLVLALLEGCAARPSKSSSPPAPARPPAEKTTFADRSIRTEESTPDLGRKIVSTVDLSVVVRDVDSAEDDVEKLAESLGGYIASASISRSDGYKRGSVTLRVPADRLDEAVGKLKEMAVRVDRYSMNTKDVTSQYTDLQARLTNLEATERELRAMLQEVRQKPNAKAEDILSVYRELADIRGKIDQVKGQIQMLDKMVTLSTINLELTPVTEVAPAGAWHPGETVRRAVHALVNAMIWFANAFIWLVLYILPVLLIVGAFFGAIVYLVRRFLWRRKPEAGS